MRRGWVPTEASEQMALFEWADVAARRYPQLRMMFHIPNGGSRDPREAHNLRLQGVRAGVPDIFLAVPKGNYHGLFIEMKRTRGGRLSEEQKGWISALTRQGYMAVVCRGWQEARGVIMGYLGAETIPDFREFV